jgi:hypothetical protein
VINATVSLTRNNYYTVLAVDKLANITPLVLTGFGLDLSTVCFL